MDALFLVKQSGRYGYINRCGDLVVDYIYERAGSFDEGLAPVQKDGRFGYIDCHGNVRIEFRFEMADGFSEGLAAVMCGGVWGYVDPSGVLKLDMQYRTAGDFHNGFAWVKFDEGGSMVYIDKSGHVCIRLPVDSRDTVFSVNCNRLRFEKGGKVGFLDAEGRVIVAPICSWRGTAFRYCQDRAWVVKDGRSGLIDENGDTVIPFGMFFVADVAEGRVSVRRQDGLWGYTDLDGGVIIAPRYSRTNEFVDGLALVQDAQDCRRWLVIDREGENRAMVHCDAAEPFSQGLAAVEVQGLSGYVDTAGHIVVPPQFTLAGSFKDGMGEVWMGPDSESKFGYVDLRGNLVWHEW